MKKTNFFLAACALAVFAVGCRMEPPDVSSEAEELSLEVYEAEAAGLSVATGYPAAKLTPRELLGKYLFFDKNLSKPRGQACAVCHGPEVGFTGPVAEINRTTVVYPGAVPTRFGNRKPPTSAYAGDSPVLSLVDEDWIGGMFWDGRATGAVLGDPLAEQAQGPFLNPLEQNLPDVNALVKEVKRSSYAGLFLKVWGKDSLSGSNLDLIFKRIAFSIAAYERSPEVNPFSSKYDAYLKGKARLTWQESRGLALFNDPEKGNCAACHPSEGVGALFTDFTYDNLGIPRNPDNPFYDNTEFNPLGEAWVDLGLGGFLDAAGYPDDVVAAELGKQKVPTLRNVDKRPYPGFVKAYGHNGYFKSLYDIVHFYNTRDVPEENWPEPEVAANVNPDELGNLGLNKWEELAIVAFLKTLSDGYRK